MLTRMLTPISPGGPDVEVPVVNSFNLWGRRYYVVVTRDGPGAPILGIREAGQFRRVPGDGCCQFACVQEGAENDTQRS